MISHQSFYYYYYYSSAQHNNPIIIDTDEASPDDFDLPTNLDVEEEAIDVDTDLNPINQNVLLTKEYLFYFIIFQSSSTVNNNIIKEPTFASSSHTLEDVIILFQLFKITHNYS